MSVWEFKPGNVNDYAPLVFTSDRDIESGMFDAEGEPLSWKKRPKIEVFVEPRKKKAQPLADISALTPGALALNDKAKAALEPFLSRFGQLLEMDCEGEPRWFYNVTNVVSCIDEGRSERRPTGALSKEAFSEERVPAEAAVEAHTAFRVAVPAPDPAGPSRLPRRRRGFAAARPRSRGGRPSPPRR